MGIAGGYSALELASRYTPLPRVRPAGLAFCPDGSQSCTRLGRREAAVLAKLSEVVLVRKTA